MLARLSGTSMASPFVAGLVALMFEAAGRPLAVRQTRQLLLATARPLSPGEPQSRWGSGYVDVAAAVAAAAEVGSRTASAVSERLNQQQNQHQDRHQDQHQNQHLDHGWRQREPSGPRGRLA